MSQQNPKVGTPKGLAKHQTELRSLVREGTPSSERDNSEAKRKKQVSKEKAHASNKERSVTMSSSSSSSLSSSSSSDEKTKNGQLKNRGKKSLKKTSDKESTGSRKSASPVDRQSRLSIDPMDDPKRVEEDMDYDPSEESDRPDFRLYNASIIMERYSDIFSDFDPRPYAQRSISDDFIDEVKKRCRGSESAETDSKNNVLHLMMPEHKRNLEIENQVCERIRSLFEKLYRRNKKELRSARLRGALWLLLGALFLVISVPVDHYKDQMSCTAEWESAGAWTLSILSVLLSPAGWYFFWEGLGWFFFRTNKPANELAVFKRMKNLTLMFDGYQKQFHAAQQQALRSVVDNAEDYLRTTFASPTIVRASRMSSEFRERESEEDSQTVRPPDDAFLDL